MLTYRQDRADHVAAITRYELVSKVRCGSRAADERGLRDPGQRLDSMRGRGLCLLPGDASKAAWIAMRYGESTELRRKDVERTDEVVRVRRAGDDLRVSIPKSDAATNPSPHGSEGV
jgi:hypothetical protein